MADREFGPQLNCDDEEEYGQKTVADPVLDTEVNRHSGYLQGRIAECSDRPANGGVRGDQPENRRDQQECGGDAFGPDDAQMRSRLVGPPEGGRTPTRLPGSPIPFYESSCHDGREMLEPLHND
ncbi:hypothetical protein GCM10009748_16250 [Agromyces lapidis]